MEWLSIGWLSFRLTWGSLNYASKNYLRVEHIICMKQSIPQWMKASTGD
jgi:hypothetical protein